MRNLLPLESLKLICCVGEAAQEYCVEAGG